MFLNFRSFLHPACPLSFLFSCDRRRVRQPIYYITLLSFCQVNKLWTRSGSFYLFSLNSLALPRDSLSIISHLLRFVKWTFCEVLPPLPFTFLRFPATALLLYHLFPLLSSKLLVKFYCWILWKLNKTAPLIISFAPSLGFDNPSVKINPWIVQTMEKYMYL